MRKRANVCENREQSRNHHRDSKWQKETAREKIEGKLYIIKEYREPLKKPHIRDFFFATANENPQQQERGSVGIMQDTSGSNQTKPNQIMQ